MSQEDIVLKSKWHVYIWEMVIGTIFFLSIQWLVNNIFDMPVTYFDRKYRSMAIFIMWMIPPLFTFLILRGLAQYHIFTPKGILLVRFNKIKDNKIYLWKELKVEKFSNQDLPNKLKKGGMFICLKDKTPLILFKIEMLSFCELGEGLTNHLSAAKLMLENGKDGLSDESLKNLQEYIEYYEKKTKN